MTPVNWTKTREKYKGKWVAFEDDERTVIASGNTPKETKEKAQKKGHKNPILAHMPKEITAYVGLYEISV
ncbi:MAG: DUF5678 domain-containing protein [Candidatus Spechtbacteria bacterium]|nr:DUF5678 domain-containing protein [Candidatus Spechtbacteria bacterium]